MIEVYEHGDLRLAYETIGPEDGMPVLALHGMGCNRGLMIGCLEPVFAGTEGKGADGNAPGAGGQTGGAPCTDPANDTAHDICGASYRRIYVDLPGMGVSNAPLSLASSEAILEALTAFVQDVIGARRFALAGQSYGGYLATGIASTFVRQLAGLLLICPLVKAGAATQKTANIEQRVIERAYIDALPSDQRESFLRNAVVATERTHRRFLAESAPGFAQADLPFIERLHQNLAYAPEQIGRIDATRVSCPTLVVCGRQDSLVGYRDQLAIVERYPKATFAVLDEAGHNLQIERDALFTALSTDWLVRIEDAG